MVDASPLAEETYHGAMQLAIATLNTKFKAFSRDSKPLGTVEQFVIDMFSGQTEYAVLSLGGFLGIGQKYHPIPFSCLRLSTASAGYIIDVDKALIDGSPGYRVDDAPVFDDAYGKRIRSYYSVGMARA